MTPTPLVRFHLIPLSLVFVSENPSLSALLMSDDEASWYLLADRAITEDSDEELLPTFTREPLENAWLQFVLVGEYLLSGSGRLLGISFLAKTKQARVVDGYGPQCSLVFNPFQYESGYSWFQDFLP